MSLVIRFRSFPVELLLLDVGLMLFDPFALLVPGELMSDLTRIRRVCSNISWVSKAWYCTRDLDCIICGEHTTTGRM